MSGDGGGGGAGGGTGQRARTVGAALDGRVVGGDRNQPAVHAADAGDDARRRHLLVAWRAHSGEERGCGGVRGRGTGDVRGGHSAFLCRRRRRFSGHQRPRAPYRPRAASGDSSRKGEPSSSSSAMRSRGSSLPRERWRSMAAAPPPARARACSRAISSHSAPMAAALASKAGEKGRSRAEAKPAAARRPAGAGTPPPSRATPLPIAPQARRASARGARSSGSMAPATRRLRRCAS